MATTKKRATKKTTVKVIRKPATKKTVSKKTVPKKRAINRPSQITKLPPEPRLVKRRLKNTVKGYFPNPINTNGYGIFEMSGNEPTRCIAIYGTLADVKEAGARHAKNKTIGIYKL